MFSKTPKVCELLTKANDELESQLVRVVAKQYGLSQVAAQEEVRRRVQEKVEKLCRV